MGRLDWVGCGWAGCDWEEAEWEGWLPCRSINGVVGRSGTRTYCSRCYYCCCGVLLCFFFVSSSREERLAAVASTLERRGVAWRGVRGVASAAIHGIRCFFCFCSNTKEAKAGRSAATLQQAAKEKSGPDLRWVAIEIGQNAWAFSSGLGSRALGLGSLAANCPGSSTPCTRYSRLQMIDWRL